VIAATKRKARLSGLPGGCYAGLPRYDCTMAGFQNVYRHDEGPVSTECLHPSTRRVSSPPPLWAGRHPGCHRQAAAANKEDKELAAASKAAVDKLLKLKEEFAKAEERCAVGFRPRGLGPTHPASLTRARRVRARGSMESQMSTCCSLAAGLSWTAD
jgi:hypothetical protein